MPRPVVQIEGARELRRQLRQIADAGLKKELRDAHKAAAEIVVRRALPNVPVRTGRLKRSVRALGTQTAGRAVAGSGRMPPYAPPIHWGWPARNIPRRPFLLDAAQAVRDEVIDVYGKRIDSLLDKIRGR